MIITGINMEAQLAVNEIFLFYFKSLSSSLTISTTLMKQCNPVLHFKGRRFHSAFTLLYLIDMFLPFIFEDLYFNMQCTRDCNLAEITPI